MLPEPQVLSAAAGFAHPLLGNTHAGIPTDLVAVMGAVVLVTVALGLPDRPAGQARGPDFGSSSWSGQLSRPQVATRTVAVLVLALAIAAGRLGADDELENVAPALVIGAGWPLLVAGTLLLGTLWRWLDPWDALARVLTRGERDEQPPSQVWPAVAVAVPVVWYLSAYPDPLDPRSVGAALALYTAFTVAGCVAFGRVRWLASTEPIGIFLSWLGLLPRRRLADWQPPRGAATLLGVLAGGVLFGSVRRSAAWSGIDPVGGRVTHSTLGLLALCAVTVAFFLAMTRVAGRVDGRPGIARAAVPAVAGVIVATALARNRLSTSLQLLPGLLGDPFGEGWDLLGPAVDGLNPAPLGVTGLLAAQLTVLFVTHLLGALVLARRLQDAARIPGATAVAMLLAGSVFAVAVH